MMKDKKIKKIPYGVADYELLVRQNSYYVDKTAFLPVVEEAGNYLFFIRPRRFGKSLLFYLGLLTIRGPEKNQLRLEIPNETVKRLYYDYIGEAG